MQSQSQVKSVDTGSELVVRMALTAWNTENDRINKLIDKLSDGDWHSQIASGKNSGIYLLGHLIAVNDNLLPLFGLGAKLYPNLEKVFLSSPDSSGLEKPSLAELKTCWTEVNAALNGYFVEMTADEWFGKHNAVSADDFVKEPHRNKLNVLMNRTVHQSYHRGQLVLLEKK